MKTFPLIQIFDCRLNLPKTNSIITPKPYLTTSFSVGVTQASLAKISLSTRCTTVQHGTYPPPHPPKKKTMSSSNAYNRGNYYQSGYSRTTRQNYPLSLSPANLAYNNRFQSSSASSYRGEYGRSEERKSEFEKLIETKRNDRNARFSCEDRDEYSRGRR